MIMKKLIAILAVMVPVLCFGAGKDIKTVSFKTHLHCENCVKKVVENVSYVKGVKDLDVSLQEQRITIKYDAAKTNVTTLAAEIQKLGYKCVEEKPLPPCEICGKTTDCPHRHKI